jgi:D-3-phosphoglycerate dehydrogenase / 2-oxoglutarate reductase
MRILLASPVDVRAVETLRQRHEVVIPRDGSPTLAEGLREADVLVVRSGVRIDARTLAGASRLALVIRAGSGTDNLDLAELARRGIALERIPGPGADAVAEMTFALLLALLRRIVEADRDVRAGVWRKHELTGARLAGRTLGVVGAGNIGTRVGRLGRALGMPVIGCVEHDTARNHARLVAAGIEPTDLDRVLRRADVVSVHVPLTPATHGLIDAAALGRMRRGSYLVSLARGGVVDELALRTALVSGHLAGAALDVHAEEGPGMRSPLADLPNVVLTPHLGAGTHEAQREIGERVVDLVERLTRRSDPSGATPAEVVS